MSAILAGSQLRQILLGTKVERATATLPQTATGAIFNITGGRILVTGLIGEVTAATGATATNISIVSTPTSGTAVTLSSVTSVASKEVGSQVTLPTTSGSATVVNTAGGGGQLPGHAPYVLAAGSLGITTSASNTGSVKWTLTYIPLDDNATVAAV